MRRIRNPLYNLVVSGVRLPLSPPVYQKGTTMIGKYKVITLCGSMKFKDDFLREQKRLTLEGNIVLAPNMFLLAEDITEDIKKMLDDMHKRRIDMADEIFVINKNSYVGSSTKSEIEYAQNLGKKINFMEN